ncbi:MAG: MotA/TolQ/ExbB proton channel family protein [Rickettsiales bacterium]|nr:MotA/TolQ/ExbB proton channel family protein [Rickettsiales bacterium]
MAGKAEFSTLLGILLGLLLVLVAIFIGSKPGAFFDVPSIIIVFGGTLFISAGSFTFSDVFKAFGVVGSTLFFTPSDVKSVASKCLTLADISRKEGILSLQKQSKLFPDDSFFIKNINLVIDGVKPEQAEKIMIEEISSIASRHSKTIEILKKAAEIAPAMGLVGTLIGLVQMLGALDDPSKIGPAMAVALLTTLYGAVTSYMILQPLATKLERNSSVESDLLAMFAEAIMSIGRNEGPYMLEMKLNALLPPDKKLKKYTQ